MLPASRPCHPSYRESRARTRTGSTGPWEAKSQLRVEARERASACARVLFPAPDRPSIRMIGVAGRDFSSLSSWVLSGSCSSPRLWLARRLWPVCTSLPCRRFWPVCKLLSWTRLLPVCWASASPVIGLFHGLLAVVLSCVALSNGCDDFPWAGKSLTVEASPVRRGLCRERIAFMQESRRASGKASLPSQWTSIRFSCQYERASI